MLDAVKSHSVEAFVLRQIFIQLTVILVPVGNIMARCCASHCVLLRKHRAFSIETHLRDRVGGHLLIREGVLRLQRLLLSELFLVK